MLFNLLLRSVLCQYNDHRWDVGHCYSGGFTVSSPRSKRRQHAEMGEAELRHFILISDSLGDIHPAFSLLALRPTFLFQIWCTPFVSLHSSISNGLLLGNISSVHRMPLCQFLFLFTDFLGCDSCSSVSLPLCAHQMPRRRLQQERISKRSGKTWADSLRLIPYF